MKFKNLICQWTEKIQNLIFRYWKILLIIPTLFVTLPIGLNLIKAKSKKQTFKTITVKKKDIVQTISASGKIKADEEVTLKFQTSGRLAWVGVKEGDKVKKWQAIASLDKRELEKNLKKELLDYMNERWDFEQTTLDDYRDQALTETIRRVKEKAQFDLDKTVLDVEIADIALKYATLVTPIEGIVTKIEAPFPGVNITPATAEFVISNPNSLIFSANVDEVDIGKIKPGQEAKIVLDAYPNETIETQVKEISFTATTTTGGGTAFEVKFPLPPNTPDEKFKLGMNGDIEIIVSKKENPLVIPQEAVKEKNGRQIVTILENKKQREVEVEIGLETDTEVEIISGLNENQKVIISEKE